MAGSFLCAAMVVGFTTYIFGLFVIPVTEELEINRANFNYGMITLMLGMVIMSPIVGQLADHFSVRKLLLFGGFCFGGGLIAISRLSDPWIMLSIIALPLAFAFGACGMITANTVTVRWFSNRRGRALGILALSTSVGGFVAQPVTAFLISSMGWRDALFTVGVGSLVIILLAAIFIVKDRPTGKESGYADEFDTVAGWADSVSNQSGDKVSLVADRVWTKSQLLTNRNFWLTAISIGVLFGIDQAVLVSQVPYFQDTGLDITTAALLVSVKTISAIIGKLAIGYYADKVDLRILFTAVAGCNAVLMTVYIIQPGFWGLLVSVSLLGVAVGGVFPVWTTIMAWLFGAKSYGTVMGLMSIVTQPFAILTLRFVGEVYDRSGSYVPAFTTFSIFALGSIGLVWLLKPAKSISTTKG